MALRDQTLITAVWTDSLVRMTNDAGTPLVSAVDNASGEAIPDTYSLAISAVAGGTCTVTVNTAFPNNPYKGRVVTGVPIDGVTVVKSVIPGVSLVLSNTAVNANAATVRVGINAGTFDAFGIGAGTPSAGERHQVVNDGTGAVANALAGLRTQAIQVKKVGTVFDYVRPFAQGATEKIAGGGSNRISPYTFTISNVAGAGVAKTADIAVAGVVIGVADILDLSTGAQVGPTGLKAIAPGYGYRFTAGPLTGLEFALSSTCASGDAANVMVFSPRYIQIAPDNAGVAGAWGVVDVVLTQAGQAAGVIQPVGVAYYWTRVLVPAGASSESNPYPGNVALSGTETGAANWLG